MPGTSRRVRQLSGRSVRSAPGWHVARDPQGKTHVWAIERDRHLGLVVRRRDALVSDWVICAEKGAVAVDEAPLSREGASAVGTRLQESLDRVCDWSVRPRSPCWWRNADEFRSEVPSNGHV